MRERVLRVAPRRLSKMALDVSQAGDSAECSDGRYGAWPSVPVIFRLDEHERRDL